VVKESRLEYFLADYNAAHDMMGLWSGHGI